MNDPVLNRKMFRQIALKKGKLQPKRYNTGSPAYGVSPYGPFLTNESQGIGPNYLENQPGNRVVVKDGRRMIVDRFGNVIKTEYMPAPYKKPGLGTRLSQGFFNVADRIPGIGSSEGMQKNVQSVRNFGKKATDPQTYLRGAKTVGSGIKSIAKQTPSVIAVEKALEKTGLNPVDKALGMPNEGFATLLTSEGFKAASDRMVKSPNAMKRGIGYMMRVPGAAGFARAAGTRLMSSPVGIATMTVGGAGYGLKKLEDYLRANNPAYKAQAEAMQTEANREIFDPMTPDDMMNVMTNQQKNDMRNIVPNAGTEGAMAKSDLETKGEVNNLVAKKPEEKTSSGDGGGNIPTGIQKPGGAPEGGSLESNISKAAGTKTDLNNTLKVNNKETGIDRKLPGLSISDKLQKFSQTTAGNMFMLKFAAGLLSGKGSFGEVVGNALNPAVDLLAAYRLKEDENAYKQMKLLLDAKGKEELQPGMIRIVDEDGSVRAVMARRDKKTLKTYRIFPDGKEVELDSAQAAAFRPYQDNKVTDVNDALTAYSNVATARALTDFVLNQDTALLGTSGFAKRTFDKLIGAGKGYFEAFSKADLKPPTFTDSNGNPLTGDSKKQAEKTWSEVTAGSKEIFNKVDPTERKRLEQLGLTETTLRYFLANAFKQKDRLTNVDLQLINDLVQTMGGFLSGAQVKDKMEALQGILDEKMNTYKENIRDYGIDDYQFATRFYEKPGAKITFGLVAEDTAPEFKTFKDDPKKLEDYLKQKGFK